jgi:hypothetical protein
VRIRQFSESDLETTAAIHSASSGDEVFMLARRPPLLPS